MVKVLVVEDDVEMSEMIGNWLGEEHYTVNTCHSGKQGLELMRFYKFDVVVLDWELPEIKGVDICREFRSRGGGTPILMLTARKNIADKERGFEAGVDDYLTKPFDRVELSARLRSLLRRPPTATGTTIHKGNFEVDTVAYRVTHKGNEIQLSPLEFRVFETLIKSAGQVLSPDAIIAKVWGDSGTASLETLRSCVKTTRKKTAMDSEVSPIKTVHGQGYVFEIQEPARAETGSSKIIGTGGL